MSTAAGFDPKPPIILTNISCAESRQEAQERAHRFLGRKWQSIDDHYHFSDGHLANVKGYEAYGKTAKTYAKLKDPANLKKATDFYVSIQIVGTPDDCLQQLGRLQQITGLEHLVAEFSFGNLPHHEAETNMRLLPSAACRPCRTTRRSRRRRACRMTLERRSARPAREFSRRPDARICPLTVVPRVRRNSRWIRLCSVTAGGHSCACK
jgi:hypothetical protein